MTEIALISFISAVAVGYLIGRARRDPQLAKPSAQSTEQTLVALEFRPANEELAKMLHNALAHFKQIHQRGAVYSREREGMLLFAFLAEEQSTLATTQSECVSFVVSLIDTADFPHCVFTPKNFRQLVSHSGSGLAVVQLPHYASFARQFVVRAADSDATAQLLSVPIVRTLEAFPDIAVELFQQVIMLSTRGNAFNQGKADSLVRLAETLCSTLAPEATIRQVNH